MSFCVFGVHDTGMIRQLPRAVLSPEQGLTVIILTMYLCSADVTGSSFASDMLFSRLQCKSIARSPISIPATQNDMLTGKSTQPPTLSGIGHK